MSGVLVVEDDGVDWFVANWIWEGVFRDVKPKLNPGRTLDEVNDGTYPNSLYLDIRLWDKSQVSELLQAAEDGFGDVVGVGPTGMSSPGSYPIYVDAFQKLLGVLRAHPILAEVTGS